jgi:hypothetical protein
LLLILITVRKTVISLLFNLLLFNSRREKSRVVLDLYNVTRETTGESNEAQKFYIQSLQDHLVLLNKQIKDACNKILTLEISIEEKEKEKDKNEEEKALMKSRKRKLQDLIPSFENSKATSEVNRATRETLCVKNNTIELLDSEKEGCESSDDDDEDDEIFDGGLKPASKK